MAGWLVRRWALTARPVLIKEDKPKGFRYNRRMLKAGETRVDKKKDIQFYYYYSCGGAIAGYMLFYWYTPKYSENQWARRRAYEEILKEDMQWATSTRREYGLDRFPRNIWHDRLDRGKVRFPEVTFDGPWPGTGDGPVRDDSDSAWFLAAAKYYLGLGPKM